MLSRMNAGGPRFRAMSRRQSAKRSGFGSGLPSDPHAYTGLAKGYVALGHSPVGDADGFFAAIGYSPHHGFAPWVRTEQAILRFKDDSRYAACSPGSRCRHRHSDVEGHCAV
jgi:hypothetical protein